MLPAEFKEWQYVELIKRLLKMHCKTFQIDNFFYSKLITFSGFVGKFCIGLGDRNNNKIKRTSSLNRILETHGNRVYFFFFAIKMDIQTILHG